MSKRFRFGVGTTGYSYIYAPNGSAIIRYWFCSFGQLGGVREFNAEFIRGANKTIVCRHGGMTRSLTKFLNTGIWANANDVNDLYDGQTTLGKLNDCRKKPKTNGE